MYDPKFEKAVQRKMEELEFRPSESVWVSIEKAVSGQRRRRALPFFWRLIVPAMLLIAAGAYYFGEKAGRKEIAPAVLKTEGKEIAPVGMKAEVGEVAGEVKAGNKQNVTEQPGQQSDKGSKVMGDEASVNRAGLQGKKVPGRARKAAMVMQEGGGRKAEGGDGGKVGDAADPTGGSRPDHYRYHPGLEDQRIVKGVSAGTLASEKGMVRLGTVSKVRRPWEAGFVAGGGIDRLNRLDASQANNAVSFMAASLYSLNRTAISKDAISDVRPDASFYAGIYLQKPISNRWVLDLGLNLHYYSVRMSVGQQVNAFVPASGSLFTQTLLTGGPAPMVYTVGDKQIYTNRYYMLELPVAMQYRINKSRILPLFLEGGVSVSRLMGANALFYNPMTGLYLKSDNVLNKTQLNLSSSLLVGLPVHGIRIQAGPQVQYGLTPLINSQGLGDQHFFYTGIRVVVLPGRR